MPGTLWMRALERFGFPDSGLPQPEITVRADRPFRYLIRDSFTGIVLFSVQVMDPTS